LLSYQGPFGVGYLAAVLHEERTLRASAEPSTASEIASEQEPPRELLQIAHAALAAHVRGAAYTPSSLAAPWARSRGVFVTLYRHGELRGCIGHLEPSCATLAQEIATCAVASATRDTRFSPLQSDELDALDVEISLLSPPEAIADQSQLDPQRYGVVVSAGARRGVLLPAIRGIETARDQVRIAASKAGLRLDTPYTLERFAVLKVKDQRPHLDAPSASSEPRGRHGYN
jgi:AmmeMemoRadiSam system protein A